MTALQFWAMGRHGLASILRGSAGPGCLLPLHFKGGGAAIGVGLEEKEQFVRLMRAYEGFCQVRVLSYCVMSNHFHIMVEVRKRPEGAVYSDEWLLKQAALIYSQPAVRMLRETLETFRSQGHDSAAEELKERYLGRMWDVSQFMKELKQRFCLSRTLATCSLAPL